MRQTATKIVKWVSIPALSMAVGRIAVLVKSFASFRPQPAPAV
jgi:hypothetical protein